MRKNPQWEIDSCHIRTTRTFIDKPPKEETRAAHDGLSGNWSRAVHRYMVKPDGFIQKRPAQKTTDSAI